MKADRRKQIKKRLREIARNPNAPGAAEEAQRLTAEYKRLQSAERTPAAEPAPADPDAEAIATWPPELRARLQRSSFNRVVDRGSSVHDPGGWDTLNDPRRSR
ncbi:hypothetical protein EJ357_03550 [Streptomyces cyaneochromogenes]|uniref:Uncharacterized protein n=1 Tax=Streptomyces cyaneochromogenes TaxID=2496836 RepID=A0A3S9M0B0_9ACTN|nr:hypothetical protein [Streptomyces cyaneochromogenes]AZQ32631.1 hypothetical protein EJ357_03550 [Streptomyces cyaneochromogenes]